MGSLLLKRLEKIRTGLCKLKKIRFSMIDQRQRSTFRDAAEGEVVISGLS
jgi:hypothetical protein